MSITVRAWLTFVAIFSIALLNAQSSAADELRRADKQFALYAYNLAQKSYENVLKTEPYNTHALSRMADCYMQLNQPDEALPWYERASVQEDVKRDVLLSYGKALMAVGNYTAAKKWFVFYAEHDKQVGSHYSEMCGYALSNAGKDALYMAKNEGMSSPSSDFSATFYGKKVVFSSSRTDLARKSKGQTTTDWSGSAYNQLYVTQTDKNGFLQKPTFLKSDLSNTYNEGPVSFSADGKRVAYCKNNFINGTRQIAVTGINMSLYIADVADGDWVNAKAFPYNGSDYATGFPSLSDDGNTLYFASNRPEGNGGWDIYVTTWNGKYWSTPENLGNKVNSPGNEITPYFDGKNLYFSSDWHYGLGGMDVFKAESERGDWTKILHLGPGINSSRDDYGFIFNTQENVGYLTSNRPQGKGNEDIWRVQKKTDDFLIMVLDANKKPVFGATLDFSNCNGSEFTTDADGKYAFSVTAGQANCQATVRKKGYKDAGLLVKSGGNKNITVVLESDLVSKFYGKIVDFSTKKPVEEALIRALPVPKGDVLTATTDKEGKYTLQLDSKKVYKLQYAKEGYNDMFITLETGDAKPSNEISDVLLQSTAVVAVAEKKPETAPVEKPVPASKTVPDPKPEPATDLKPVEHTTNSAPAPPKMKTEVENMASGFSVQLASAVGEVSPAELKKYDALKPYGNVYTQSAGKSTKIRLGVFTKKEDAEKAAAKAKQMQYKNAFVVEEKSIEGKLLYQQPKPVESSKPAPVKPADITEKPVESAKKQPIEKTTKPADKAKPTVVRYAVQVASLKNEETVNLAPYMKITEYGNVYTRPDKDITKIRVGVWESHDDAEAAHAEIVKKGFHDAVVVTEKAVESTERFLIKNKAEAKKTADKQEPEKKLTPKGSTSTTTAAEPAKGSPAPIKESNYKVRLITLASAQNFDKSKVEGLTGKLEERKEGKLTVFMLTGYPDLESAKKDRAKVLTNGFRGAHIVKEIKGKLLKVKA